jgi:hypothetical protein
VGFGGNLVPVCVVSVVLGKMDPREETQKKAEDDAMEVRGEHNSGSGDGHVLTKSEMRNEMRSMV